MKSTSENDTIAYIRVSKDSQDCKNQKFAILDFAHKENIKIDDFLEIQISSRKNPHERKIDSLLNLEQGNLLIVSEMSRIGRSVGEVVTTIDRFVAAGIQFISIKEINSLRTKEALASLKAVGIKLGRPKGSLGSSKLDGKDMEIKKLLRLKVSKTSISKILEVDRSTLKNYMVKKLINIV